MNLNRLAFLAAAALVGVAAPSISTAQDAAARNLILRSSNTTAANVGTLGVTALTAPQTYTLPNSSGTVLVSAGTISPLSALRTNASGDIESVALTNGQILIGATGALPTAGTLTGTTNQITVTNAANSITLSLPQDIHTGASPQFAGLTVTTGPIGLTSTGTNDITITPGGDLVLLGIDNVAPITDLLWIDGSNRVRRAAFSGTADEGIQFESSEYRLGVSAGTDASPWNNNAFTTDRYVNLNTFDLFFTTANANNSLLTLTGDATNGAVTLASFGTGDVTLSASDEIIFATAGSERMTVEADGDLGIGIATAIAPLHVSRAVSAGTMDVLLMNGAAAGTLNSAVQITFANDIGATPAAPNAFIRSENTGGLNNAATLSFGTWDGAASATRMSIAPNGNVTVAGTITINNAGGNDLTLSETTISRGGNIAINPGTTFDITTDGGITSAENVTITTGGLTVTAGGAGIEGTTNINTAAAINTTTIGNNTVGNTLTVDAPTVNLTNLPAGADGDNLVTILAGAVRSASVSTALATSAWLVGGNTLTAPGTYTVGTNSAHDFALESGGTTRLTLANGSALGTAAMSIVPSADNTYSLGTDAVRWSNAYLNGSSLHIGPTGGQAANTELSIGYNSVAGTGSINANGGASPEILIGSSSVIIEASTTINNNLANSVNINTGTSTGAVTIGGGAGTVAISSTGLNIATSGDISDAGGAVVVNDAGGFNVIQGGVDIDAGGLNVDAGGATIVGATSINANANNATNINTGTSTGAVTIGGGLGTVAIASTGLNVSTAGVISDAGGDIEVSDNVVPSADATYSLGTDAVRWSNVYIDGASLHVGPTGGQAATTELTVGYGASVATLNANAGITELTLGTNAVTVEGATNINNNANYAVNINTGTSTGAVTIGNSAAGAVGITSGGNMTLTASAGTLTATGSQVTIDAAAGNTVAVGGTNASTLTLGNSSTATTVTGLTLAANTSTSIILTNDVSGDVGTLSMVGGSAGMSHDDGASNESNLALGANTFSLSEQDALLVSSSVSGAAGSLALNGDADVTVTSPLTTMTTAVVYTMVTDGTATPDVTGTSLLELDGTIATVTGFNNGTAGQILYIYASGTVTVQDGVGLELDNGNDYAMDAGDTLTLLYVGGAWREVSRGDNN